MVTSEVNKIEIENYVKNLRINYDIHGIPVDPVSIARALNINVYKTNFSQYNSDSVSGAIQKKDGIVNIFVNENDSLLRQRFTIAHELGHYFLHMDSEDDHEIVDMRRTSGYITDDDHEKEANSFAAALLMQPDLVKEKFTLLQSLGFTKSYVIELLASQFAVSKVAMSYRISELGL